MGSIPVYSTKRARHVPVVSQKRMENMARISGAVGGEALKALRACKDAQRWVMSLQGDMTAEEALRACPQVLWVVWIAAKLGVDRRVIIAAEVEAARRALPVWQAQLRHNPINILAYLEDWLLRGGDDYRAAASADYLLGAAYGCVAEEGLSQTVLDVLGPQCADAIRAWVTEWATQTVL